MIVISKKRIGIILTSILIGVFAFSFQIVDNEKYSVDNTGKQEDTIVTSSTPVSGKIVVLDARPSEYQMKGHKAVMEQQKRKPT